MAPEASNSKPFFPPFFRSRKSVAQPSAAKLGFETLESRQLLAADMADIVGTLYANLQGDNDASNDLPVVNAAAALYKDGGNGVFDGAGSGDDLLVQSGAQTDSNGEYRFEGVGAGRYFVQITPPEGLHFQAGDDVREVLITDQEAEFAEGPAIDNFESEQRVSASPPLPSSDPSRMADSSVLGGERDLFVTLTQGDDRFSAVSLTSGDGLIRLASDTNVTGDAKIVWDGFDNSASGVNATGLGGVDLTEGDGSRMTGLALTVGADHPNSIVKMKIYTDANNWSEYTTVVPETDGGQATKYLIFGFEDTPNSSAGNGADFTNVGAVELTFEGVTAVDGQVSLIGLVGRTTKELDFVVEPKLSLGDHVWADVNNNGIFDPGEQGIADVKLNLYEDVDGNNEYNAAVDSFHSMDVTDSNGHYQFADLFPGKYIVQVAEQNFGDGSPLVGLVSSTGNDPAADPDNDVNGDDNGTGVAGLGVLSKSVTLTGGLEPTNDGDNDPNTNLTLDFGFYGFDLELDKEVNAGDGNQVNPEDRLVYTIDIFNNGPSTAFYARLEDTLASNTQFVSATSSNGATVNHSNGNVTSNLGNIAPGATVTITVIVDVAADATGSIMNTATVIAPNEVYLGNNTDKVTNSVDPLIDLTIDKTDSDDPVKPGQVFDYIIKATNNGPSDATGVQVTDTLPDDVQFVDASQTPVSNSNGVLRFDIGNLASGASRTINISVRVDSDFVGTLLNVAEVSGNETETNYDNNEDDEPTVVIPVIDLQIVKTDSDDPVSPGEGFSYTLEIRNNGPSDATGVTIVDTLPATGVEFQGSATPNSINGREVTFNVGDLASGESRSVDIQVVVDQSFVGTLLNSAEVSANEEETTYANNVDTEETLVVADPVSISGKVYVDRNDNGIFESNERPIPDVIVNLSGRDFQGNSVSLTTVTDAGGMYMFSNLQPGQYNITEQQPTRYRDGQETVGNNDDPSGSSAQGLAALDQFDAEGEVVSSGFGGVELVPGADAYDYNFGELANGGGTKQDYLVRAEW
ncbi:DUF11 domain-containing protein [Adhaeretor mobilis]|uniref:Serine-aspartate repeat-containing protein F n=1 Tax=Adhaeretor mobilis TaxID=1930276 RepID=A0A517MQV7_9BACT|nr:SdrD B-like domain-containing protein [Adhaeretor mobilis]QDS97157.1 Serine-aspartate repeat-containing protein F precursor [Adhaeretor mobilis]